MLDFLSVFIFYKFLSAANGSMACGAEAAEVKWFFGQWNGMVRRLPCFIATALNTNFRDWLHTFTGYGGNAALGMPRTEFLLV